MADAERIEIQSPAWKSLVKIKQGSSNLPPLFFIHDVSGSILFYRQLVECMRTDRTCYVLQPLGMDGSQPPVESVAEMATNYIEEILQVQPVGPYHLSGYSFGSFVAFEIAHQLHLQDREVGLLAVIDTIAPKLIDAADREMLARSIKSPQNYSRITKFLSLNSHERIAYIHNGLRIHRTTGKLRNPYRFYLRYIKRSLLEVGSLDVYWTNDRAFHSYTAPATYPGRVALFYSDEKLPKLAAQPALNWEQIATGGVELHPIAGSNHATIIQLPYVQVLGAQLTSALDRQS
jgi:oxalate---CoA ligase